MPPIADRRTVQVNDRVQANKVVVRRFLEELLSCGEPSLADQMLAPEAVDHKPSTPGLPGRENVSGRSGIGVPPSPTRAPQWMT
jgi:hypothetical protein